IGTEFETRAIDLISVKGKTETTRIFELLGASGQVSEQRLRLRDLYEQAWRAYLAQTWDLAEATFRECLQLDPNEGPSGVFLQRIQTLRGQPPGEDWNGVWQLVEK
ncbi:MAG: adenylate/guanylate cyclase domain-containing protein, partial [Verrucomicrobia bacterium]